MGVCLCARELAGTTLVACFGEIGYGDGHDILFLTSHTTHVVVDFAFTARQHVRVGFLVGWRNLARRYGGHCFRGWRRGPARV